MGSIIFDAIGFPLPHGISQGADFQWGMEIQWGTGILITPLEFQGGTLLPPREAVCFDALL